MVGTRHSCAAKPSGLFAADNAPEQLEVLTIHKAKGLEWDHVLLPRLDGTTRGDTPPLLRWRIQTNADAGDDLLMAVKGTGGLYDWLGDEEKSREFNERRRLLYVASTRAKRSLMLTGAKWKSPSERNDEKPWKPPAASLLALLWQDVRDAITEDSAAEGRRPPMMSRSKRSPGSKSSFTVYRSASFGRLRRVSHCTCPTT